uniref:Uncharacterized protein n=1 Tax=Meleagris gallopavo TaxID=9103 RepID=A0A803YS03_MELGA
ALAVGTPWLWLSWCWALPGPDCIPAPQMSAEERFSPHMPEALRCDACQAIAFQVRGNIHQQPCTVPSASGCWDG